MNHEKFGSIKLLKLKYRRDQIIQTFCRIRSPQKFGPPSSVCRNFKRPTKNSSDSYRTHWNVMNDEEFGSRNILKLKHRRWDQIIQTFCKFASPQKLDPPSLISINSKTWKKVLLNQAECIEI